jgi:type IV pilus modification protein PilV
MPNKKSLAFGLIEVLIATVILTIGLLGIAVLQQKSMLLSRDAENNANAEMLISEMYGRMRSNILEAQKDTGTYATTSTYTKSQTSVNSDLTAFYTNTGDNSNDTDALNTLYSDAGCTYTQNTSCNAATIGSAQIAARDLFEWKALVQTTLTNGAGIVCFDSNPYANQNSLTCDGTNPGRTSSPKNIIYTVKIRWTDSSNTDRYIMSQMVFPCGTGSC